MKRKRKIGRDEIHKLIWTHLAILILVYPLLVEQHHHSHIQSPNSIISCRVDW